MIVTAVAAADHNGARDGRTGLPWRSAMAAAFVVTLVRPASWVVGLAGFLAGGGIVLFTWAIVVLPTPTGLQNALGTPMSKLVLGTPTPELLALAVAALTGVLAVVAGGLLAGAWAERQGIQMALEAAEDEGLITTDADLRGAPGAGRVALVRLASLVPPVVAAAMAWQPIYDVTYRELILPSELVTPLPLRVIGRVPWLLAGVAVTWLLSDAAASTGVRRLVLERRSVPAAWALGWAALVRRPHRVLGTALAGIGALALLTGPSLLAAAVGWGQVRDLIVAGREPVPILAAVLVWVSIWLGGLALAGVGAAFRSAAATMEAVRRG